MTPELERLIRQAVNALVAPAMWAGPKRIALAKQLREHLPLPEPIKKIARISVEGPEGRQPGGS